MAQPSKKQQIADAALPLFLSQGFKGTSVDMVVKASGVSKPTVYNHFPDKAALFDFIIEHWLQQQPAQLAETELNTWPDALTLSLLKLAIGEGFRFPESRAKLVKYLHDAVRAPLDAQSAQAFDSRLLQALLEH